MRERKTVRCEEIHKKEGKSEGEKERSVKEDHDGRNGGKDCFSRRKRQVENKEERNIL